MKLRLIAVLLMLSLAAWLPTVAQQSPAPQPAAPATDSAKPSDKAACSCCQHSDAHAQANKSAECCAGKDAQMCAKNAKNGDKPCCDKTTCKSCCEKASASNTAAANSNSCCAAANHNCCHTKSPA
jgi:hypothetical protein